jgi:hypothetical protein
LPLTTPPLSLNIQYGSPWEDYETGHNLIPIDKTYILTRLLRVKVDNLYDYKEEK